MQSMLSDYMLNKAIFLDFSEKKSVIGQYFSKQFRKQHMIKDLFLNYEIRVSSAMSAKINRIPIRLRSPTTKNCHIKCQN